MNQTKINSLKWHTNDIANDTSYRRDLSTNEKSLVQHSLALFKESDFCLNRDAFFETFQPLCQEIMDALINKRGFILVKGFPIAGNGYGPEEIKKLLLAFCAYLGTPLIQNRNQDLIFDVKSIEGMTLDTKNFRGPWVKESLPMHTDAGAILGMYCFSAANVGGLTLLSSSRTVHDEIKALRPDLLKILYQPFYVDRRGHEPEGALPYDLNPVFAMHDDQLTCQYHQPFCNDAQKKFPELPRFTSQQIEALNFFDQISKRDDIVFEIKVEPGTIIFINNEKILHGRTSFDFPENQTVRHLFRIWLNTPQIEHTFPSYLGYA